MLDLLTKLLLHDCSSPTADVLVCVQKFGLKASALGRLHDKVPAWLHKWAALILGFVETERSLLPAQLLALRLPLVHYTPLTAAAEAKGARSLYASGLQSDLTPVCVRMAAALAVLAATHVSNKTATS